MLPLEKSRTNDEAPAFIVEVAYLDHAPPWSDKGRTRLSLVSVDLPISKSRLLVHHPPRVRLTPVAETSGSFRVTSYVEPESNALRSNTASATAPQLTHDEQPEIAKHLVSKLPPTKQSARPARNLPLRVVFPHFGPSIFLVSELTRESQTPSVEFDFSRDRKRGEK